MALSGGCKFLIIKNMFVLFYWCCHPVFMSLYTSCHASSLELAR